MTTSRKKTNIPDMRMLLFTLWIFAMLNYLFCDIMSLMDVTKVRDLLDDGAFGTIQMTSEMLLGGAFLMEIPMVMVLLSRILPQKANRIAQIIAGAIMTLAQTGSLFAGGMIPEVYYIFCSVIEIATTVVIVVLAVRWSSRRAEEIQEGR